MRKHCKRGGEEGGILHAAGFGKSKGKPEGGDTARKNDTGVAQGFQQIASLKKFGRYEETNKEERRL